ncbi:MAG: dihydropteroate synthase [Bacteroidaceae bacterium]
MKQNTYTINVKGHLMDFTKPQVMGILNVTPDSFFEGSRQQTEEDIATRTKQILHEGASIIDIGAYSSRPGANHVSPKEEMERLRQGLQIIKKIKDNAIVSVDTFRADIAKMCVEEYGVAIINDISGGELDKKMFQTVATLQVPYLLMHMKGTPQTMQCQPHYDDLMREIFLYFSQKIQQLHELGVNDLILDPGFGFAKTLEHNYELFSHLEEFKEFQLPLLVGISRKSMIYQCLGETAEEALNGTTVLNTLAIIKGANILRVHDVKACVEAIQIVHYVEQGGTY